MTRALLVTLADRNYLDQAKQLLASAHFQAGWRGDYMLLAHRVPEVDLAPFRERGIRVHCPEPLWEAPVGRYPPVVVDKFHLFGPRFSEWDVVVYCDADVMLYGSLETLLATRGLAAVSERTVPLRAFFDARGPVQEALLRDLESRYELGRPSFNSGFMAFHTGIIRDDTRERLMELFRSGASLQQGEQPTLNLFFQDRWTTLPDFYATIRDRPARYFGIPPDRLRRIGHHFTHERPWQPEHPRYADWCASRARFEDLDVAHRHPPRQRWSRARVVRYYAYLHARRWITRALDPPEPAPGPLRP